MKTYFAISAVGSFSIFGLSIYNQNTGPLICFGCTTSGRDVQISREIPTTSPTKSTTNNHKLSNWKNKYDGMECGQQVCVVEYLESYQSKTKSNEVSLFEKGTCKPPVDPKNVEKFAKYGLVAVKCETPENSKNQGFLIFAHRKKDGLFLSSGTSVDETIKNALSSLDRIGN